MKRIRSVDLMTDKKIVKWLNIFSVFLILIFYFVFTIITKLLPVKNPVQEQSVYQLVGGLVLLFVLIVVHELIHGLFFKLFSPEGKVKFGFKNGMAYATSPGSRYSRGKFAWISVAPFVLISLGLTISYVAGILPGSNYVFVAAIHGACCVGDFYWVYLILRAPKDSLIEDTEVGIDFYQLADD